MVKLKPCECGCTDIFHVWDGGAVFIECAQCNRHTRPFFDEEEAERRWNINDVVKKEK